MNLPKFQREVAGVALLVLSACTPQDDTGNQVGPQPGVVGDAAVADGAIGFGDSGFSPGFADSAVGVSDGGLGFGAADGAVGFGDGGVGDGGVGARDGGIGIADAGALGDAGPALMDAGPVPMLDGGIPRDGALPGNPDAEAGVVPDSDGGHTNTEGGVGTDAGTHAPTCTGKPGMRRGKSNQMLTAAGAQRSFVYYAPTSLDPNLPVPIVIVPHGSTMSGQDMYEITKYAEVAEREKFIVMFPDGEDGPGSLAPWNVGDVACGAGGTGLIYIVEASGDDQAFVNEMIKFAEQDQCIDHDHVFMTGFSMGGFFAHETGCLNPLIRGIGPHSGATHDLSSCPNKQKPTIIFHFKNDALIEYECATSARDQWVRHNGCSAANPEVVNVKGGACEYYKGCPADGQVVLCSFDNDDASQADPRGHGWSGGSKAGSNPVAAIESTESAAELGWAFFKKYAW